MMQPQNSPVEASRFMALQTPSPVEAVPNHHAAMPDGPFLQWMAAYKELAMLCEDRRVQIDALHRQLAYWQQMSVLQRARVMAEQVQTQAKTLTWFEASNLARTIKEIVLAPLRKKVRLYALQCGVQVGLLIGGLYLANVLYLRLTAPGYPASVYEQTGIGLGD